MPKLTNLTVRYISLVETPATGKKLTLKGALPRGFQAGSFALGKADDERQVAYGVVYAPDQEDSQGDHADAETIRQASYEFMRKQRTDQVDVQHSFDEADAFVAESWIVQKGDAWFPDDPGAWAVAIQVRDPALWARLKKGELTGLSLAGTARKVSDEPQETYTRKSLRAFFASLLPPTEDPEMTEDQIKQQVRAALDEALPAALKAALPDAKADPPAGTEKTAKTKAEPAAGGDTQALTEGLEQAISKGFAELGKQLETQIAALAAKGQAEGEGIKPEAHFV